MSHAHLRTTIILEVSVLSILNKITIELALKEKKSKIKT